MIREIEQLIANGTLDQFDRYFAQNPPAACPQRNPADPCPRRPCPQGGGNGHVCLDLQTAVGGPLKKVPSPPAGEG